MRDKQTDISRNIEKSQYNISKVYLGYTFLPNALSDECLKTIEKSIDAHFFVKKLSTIFICYVSRTPRGMHALSFVTLHSSS